MLVIRATQMQHFARATLDQFAEQRRVHALTCHPRLGHFIGDAALRSAVSAGISAAMARGLRNRVEVALYLELAFLLGSFFVEDPRFPWAADLLAPDSPERPLFRIRRAFDAATHWLDESHGLENEHLVRGLLRIRALTSRPLAEQADAAGIVAWLDGLMPQQAAACGAGAMIALAQTALSRAGAYNMTAPGDAAMIALHMFMLGSGFDRDPLVPWAGPILSEGGPSRAGHLLAASLRYLDAVLN
jgi:hypothetical protein